MAAAATAAAAAAGRGRGREGGGGKGMLVVVVVVVVLVLLVIATIVVIVVLLACIVLLLARAAVAAAVVVIVVVVRVRDARSVEDSLGIKPNDPSAAAAAVKVPAETPVMIGLDTPSSFLLLCRLLGLEGGMTVVADLCNKKERVLSKVRRRRLSPRTAATEPVVPLLLVLLLPARGSLLIVVFPSKANDVDAAPVVPPSISFL